MNNFKFLRDKRDCDFSLLNNEDVVNYFTNAGPMIERVIAWCLPSHRDNPFWVFSRFQGTMEQFFNRRRHIPLDIPVIHTIETPTHMFTHDLMLHDEFKSELPNFAEDDIITIHYYSYESF